MWALTRTVLRGALRGARSARPRGCACERGAATLEHAALALLIALLFGAVVAVVAADPPERGARELAGAIARKLRCAPNLPGPCWRDPLTGAYGRPLAGLVRALAPEPQARIGPGGVELLPVHFRHCRSPSCARPGPRRRRRSCSDCGS